MDDAHELLQRCADRGVHLWIDGDQLRYRAPKAALDLTLLNDLRQHKVSLLTLLAGTDHQADSDPSAPFPLTDIQTAFVLGRGKELAYGGVGCHGYGELTAADVDADRLTQAFAVLLRRHPLLHTVLRADGTQQTLPDVPAYPVAVLDLRAAGPNDTQNGIAAVRGELSHRLYAPDQWPLFDLRITRTASHDIIHLSIDFLIADFVSLQIVLAELEQEYLQPGTVDDAGPHGQFRDWVENQAADQDSAAAEPDRIYWQQKAATLPLAPALPLLPASASPPRFQRRTLTLSPAQRVNLTGRAARHGMTLNAALLGSYAATVQRWSSRSQFSLSITVLDRSSAGPAFAGVVGDFTRVLVLAVSPAAEQSFAAWAADLQGDLLDGIGHLRGGRRDLLRGLRQRRPDTEAIFPVVFTSSLGLAGIHPDSREFRLDYGISQTPQVYLDCQVMDGPDGIIINWDYRDHVLPQDVIAAMHDEFSEHLRALSGPDERSWHERLAVAHEPQVRHRLLQDMLTAQPGITDAAIIDSPTADVAIAVRSATTLSVPDTKSLGALAAQTIASEQSFRSAVDDRSMIAYADHLDRTALLQMMACFAQLDVFADSRNGYTYQEILQAAHVIPAHHRMIRRWLQALVLHGYLDHRDNRYWCRTPVSDDDVAAGWRLVDEHTPTVEQRSELVDYFKTTGSRLPELLNGSTQPLDLLFPHAQTDIHEVAYSALFMSRYLNRLLGDIARRLTAAGEPHPCILEIGGGVGGTTYGLLDTLAGTDFDYTFTDVSQFFLNNARDRLGHDPRLSFGLLDLNQDPVAAGYPPNHYALIVCANVLHYASNIDEAVTRLRELLKPGGVLLMIEATRDSYQIMTSMEFLFDETAQHFTDVRGPDDQLFATVDQWRKALLNAQVDEVVTLPGPDPITDRMGMQVFAARFKSSQALVDTAAVAAAVHREFPGQFAAVDVTILDTLDDVETRLTTRSADAGQSTSPAAESPEGPAEWAVAAVWQQRLRRDQIGRHDRFYDLGGDSLLAAQIVAELVDTHPSLFAPVGFDQLLRSLLQNATVATLAETAQEPAEPPARPHVPVDNIRLGERPSRRTTYLIATDEPDPRLTASADRYGDVRLLRTTKPPTDTPTTPLVAALAATILNDGPLTVALAAAGADIELTVEIAREVAEQGVTVERLVLVVSDQPALFTEELLPYAGDIDIVIAASAADTPDRQTRLDALQDSCLGTMQVHATNADEPEPLAALLTDQP